MIDTTYKPPVLSPEDQKKVEAIEAEEAELLKKFEPYSFEARKKRRKAATHGAPNPFAGVDGLPKFEAVPDVMRSCDSGWATYRRESRLLRDKHKAFLVGLLKGALEEAEANLATAQKQVEEINAKLPEGVSRLSLENGSQLQVRVNQLRAKLEGVDNYDKVRGLLRGVFADKT